MTFNRQKIPATIGEMTCMGILGTAPHVIGNRFQFASGESCVNLCAENLEAALMRGMIDDNTVECIVVTADNGRRAAIVIDERIPRDWWRPMSPPTT